MAAEVDASNRVSLRGNGNVVVQINGRPTRLKGDQLGTSFTLRYAGAYISCGELSTRE
jgi:hypothetical protein